MKSAPVCACHGLPMRAVVQAGVVTAHYCEWSAPIDLEASETRAIRLANAKTYVRRHRGLAS